MNKEKLDRLFSTLSFEEKVGQMIQLTGDFFNIDERIMETGPLKKLGLHDNFEPLNVGSVLNVTDSKNVVELQTEYLKRAKHRIPLLFMADVIYGYKSIFPIPLAQTCSWNFDLIEKSAQVIAKECYDAGIHVTFSPMVDVARDARWGRVMESPGEDVLLAKKYAEHMVRGIQGNRETIGEDHIAACVKHFAAYGAPTAGREYNSVDLSMTSLRNTYLPSYKAAMDAGVKLVMTAFNTLNGIPCTGNEWLNKELLRDEYGFEGVLISDYAAIEELKYHGYTANNQESAQKAIQSTVDIDMKTAIYANELKTLTEENPLLLQLVDEAAYRVLTLKNDLGLFEDPYRGMKREAEAETSSFPREHVEAMEELARESIVLLKNDDQLPLKKKKIALIGPYSKEKSVLGFWAITGDEEDAYSLYDGLTEFSDEENLGWDIDVALGTPLIQEKDFYQFGKYADRFVEETQSQEQLLTEALEVANASDIVLLALGESAYQSGEGGSRVNPSLPEHQIALLKELKKTGKPIILIVFSGRPLILDKVVDEVEAIIYAWFPGTMSGKVLAEILSGKVNPSARLSMTFPRAVGQIPIYYSELSTGRPHERIEPYHRFASRYLDESNSPLFPFGFGLSYSQVAYTEMKAKEEAGKHYVTIQVTNTGVYPTKEVVQLYVQDNAASVVRPVKELRAFEKISLNPGETSEVAFELTDDLFSFIDNEGNEIVEAGEFTLFIGQHALDDHFQLTVQR